MRPPLAHAAYNISHSLCERAALIFAQLFPPTKQISVRVLRRRKRERCTLAKLKRSSLLNKQFSLCANVGTTTFLITAGFLITRMEKSFARKINRRLVRSTLGGDYFHTHPSGVQAKLEPISHSAGGRYIFEENGAYTTMESPIC